MENVLSMKSRTIKAKWFRLLESNKEVSSDKEYLQMLEDREYAKRKRAENSRRSRK